MRENCDTGPSETSSPLCAPPQRPSPSLFLATLFLITRKWHWPRCVPTEEGVKELWPIYTTGLKSAVRENEIMEFGGRMCIFYSQTTAFSFQLSMQMQEEPVLSDGTKSSSRVHSCLADWTLHSAFQCMQFCHQDKLYKRLGLIFMSPLSTASNIC